MQARLLPGFAFIEYVLFHCLYLEAMAIQQVHISDPRLNNHVQQVLHGENPVFMLQLPSVYALVAPPTQDGVEALHRAKHRLPGKLYGSAIGNLHNFLTLAIPDMLPTHFHDYPNNAVCMEGAFMRLVVDYSEINSPCVFEGTHQGLLLPEGPIRQLFRFIEIEFQEHYSEALFPGKQYTAPICTSANISGDPLGSIVDEDRALRFATEQEISLVVMCNEEQEEKGSYPIFYFRGNRVSIERKGPGWERMLQSMPTNIEIIQS